MKYLVNFHSLLVGKKFEIPLQWYTASRHPSTAESGDLDEYGNMCNALYSQLQQNKHTRKMTVVRKRHLRKHLFMDMFAQALQLGISIKPHLFI